MLGLQNWKPRDSFGKRNKGRITRQGDERADSPWWGGDKTAPATLDPRKIGNELGERSSLIANSHSSLHQRTHLLSKILIKYLLKVDLPTLLGPQTKTIGQPSSSSETQTQYLNIIAPVKLQSQMIYSRIRTYTRNWHSYMKSHRRLT